MSTAILPDDSVVIRLARETIHLDAKTRAIHVRVAHPGRDLGGSILASYPLSAVERVRLTRTATGRFWMYLDLKSSKTIDLGDAATQDVGMLTARVIADLTRCKVEVAQGEVARLPGAGRALDEPTRRIPWEEEETLSSRRRPPASEPETDPPDGWTPPAPREAPWARAAFEALDDPRPRAQPPQPAPPAGAPVFLDLLRESAFLAAEPPSPSLASARGTGLEHQSTQMGVGGWRGRSTTSTRLRAVFEMLRLMSEQLPVANESLADLRLPS